MIEKNIQRANKVQKNILTQCQNGVILAMLTLCQNRF